ncbi:MAG: hypothetical protein QME66_06430 [Candidatus Eisenbacteria bacterium]|nr:hypothetical protein [Candidatus Eisenbacteria bacterium]
MRYHVYRIARFAYLKDTADEISYAISANSRYEKMRSTTWRTAKTRYNLEIHFSRLCSSRKRLLEGTAG